MFEIIGMVSVTRFRRLMSMAVVVVVLGIIIHQALTIDHLNAMLNR
jgi:hypothetical protein